MQIEPLTARVPHFDVAGGGDIVTAGTITAASPICRGEAWKKDIRGIALPGLTVTFTDRIGPAGHSPEP